MDAIRVLIIDDEPLSRDTVRLLLQDRDGIEIVGECEDGEAAIAAIQSKSPDLVFLDVQMPGKNGFEVVEAIGAENMPVVIFATAYDQYALRAFEAHALDYLLKPFDDDRFDDALDRALESINRRKIDGLSERLLSLLKDERVIPQEPAEPTYLERIMVKNRDAILFVKTDEIDWVESAGDYVSLHVGKKTHLIRDTMTAMEDKLDPKRFVRIHRSSIVNVERIKELRPYFHGDYIVYLHDGTELRLSRRYWDRLERLLGAA